MSKPILCIDFDGVIHDYKKGWQDGSIYGDATPGFFKWAVNAVKYFKLVIYSSRSKDPDGIRQMGEAFGKWSIDAIHNGEVASDFEWPLLFDHIEFANEKPPAFLTIDDRAITFEGKWDGIAMDPLILQNFKPWNAP